MRKSIAASLVVLGVSVPALAIFGIGDIVFDPSNYEQSLQQVIQLQQQYSQLVQTYHMIQSQYDHMLWTAKQVPVNMALRYRASATPWTSASATNTYGTTQGWVTGVNTGLNVAAGYANATLALAAYGRSLAALPANHLGNIKTSYATVELTDGANLSAMQTLGRLRANAPLVETAIQNLESDSLSSDPNMNTQIAVLNKINAAHVIGLRSGQETNKLLVALTEDQVIQAKRQRDAEARAFNSHIRFIAEGQAVMAAQAANASQAMRDWRMP